MQGTPDAQLLRAGRLWLPSFEWIWALSLSHAIPLPPGVGAYREADLAATHDVIQESVHFFHLAEGQG